jgi:GNAT superfamily N-acetyltransferase
MAIVVSTARASDAPRLTEIAFAAKRHWGYPEAWMRCWVDLLTITPDYVAKQAVFVAREGNELLGFAAVRAIGTEGWIDHLWVTPVAMRRGIGRALFSRCEDQARASRLTKLRIESDPHEEFFYLRMGARVTERKPAPMGGVERFLPIMEKDLG